MARVVSAVFALFGFIAVAVPAVGLIVVILSGSSASALTIVPVTVVAIVILLWFGGVVKVQDTSIDLADAAGRKIIIGEMLGTSFRHGIRMLGLLIITPATFIPRYNLAFYAMVDQDLSAGDALSYSAKITAGKNYIKNYAILEGTEVAANMIAGIGSKDGGTAPLIENAISVSKAKKYLEYKAAEPNLL